MRNAGRCLGGSQRKAEGTGEKSSTNQLHQDGFSKCLRGTGRGTGRETGPMQGLQWLMEKPQAMVWLQHWLLTPVSLLSSSSWNKTLHFKMFAPTALL